MEGSLTTVLNLVNDGPAGLWAIVEINLWVVVATIPTLRPLVSRTVRKVRDRSCTYRSKTYVYQKKSKRGVLGRFWPSKGPVSNPADGHLPFDGVEPAVAEMWPSRQTCDVKISAPARALTDWTPLSTTVGKSDVLEMSNKNAIRVDQEFDLSHPAKFH